LCSGRAQDQERKLIDRLLKPDMTLQSDAQNKKFMGDGSASINKQATVGTFYVHQKPRSKNFAGARDFSTTQFNSQTYHGGRSAYEVSSQQTMMNSRSAYANQTARGVRDALNLGKRLPLARTQERGRFWAREKVRSRSINKTRRLQSTRCASC